ERYFAQVFGRLVKEVTPCLGGDVELLADLKNAVEVRNHLVHRYWREKIELVFTIQGKNRMIGELQDTIQLFVDVDKRLYRVMLTYAAVRGVTMEDIDRLAEEQRLKVVAFNGLLLEEIHDLSKDGRDR